MEIEAHVAAKPNSKGKNYEDRYLLPLGDLPRRVEEAETVAQARVWQAKIDERSARGLLFAVMDGVGGAPLGMRAAQKTVDVLRELYTRPELAPREDFPTAREVLDLLHEANREVNSWGNIGDDEGAAVAGAGASGRPKGAAAVTAAYFSPSGNLTLLQAGDTAAFVYRVETGRLEVYTGADDVAGQHVRKYIGLGDSLYIDAFSPAPLGDDDLVALVSDGVYPKGILHRNDLKAVFAEQAGDPEGVANELAERARNRGSVDDITALVLMRV